ncbi:hypothetical protein GCM10008020_08930 [Massilia psychrophila]|nr:hypothetical protein GCM10008020_08930 [Massilia psychrophila]
MRKDCGAATSFAPGVAIRCRLDDGNGKGKGRAGKRPLLLPRHIGVVDRFDIHKFLNAEPGQLAAIA